MEMRYLGRTGVRVSVLCFGTMTFGKNQWGVGHVREAEAKEMVAACLDAGINFFDTADVYSLGESETLLGKAVRGRRAEVVIATKVRGRMGPEPNRIGLSRHHILNSIDGSLKRLGTDYVDLYQVHGWDHATPLEETLRALDDLVRWGKVRYVGASNFAAWQLAKALGISDKHGLARFETLQPYYSLVGRDIEHEIVPLCLDQEVGILPWSPLAGGFLSGKYRKDRPAPEEARLSGPLANFIPVDREKATDILSVLEEVADAHKASMAAAALSWLSGRPGVTSVIIGARTMKQLEDNLKAAEISLNGEERTRLDELSAIPVPYPQWMIGYMRQDR